eukprot:3764779-Alexandrium_andersonii.AAC.1
MAFDMGSEPHGHRQLAASSHAEPKHVEETQTLSGSVVDAMRCFGPRVRECAQAREQMHVHVWWARIPHLGCLGLCLCV